MSPFAQMGGGRDEATETGIRAVADMQGSVVDGRAGWSGSAVGALFDTRGELLDVVVDLAALSHLLADLALCVHCLLYTSPSPRDS